MLHTGAGGTAAVAGVRALPLRLWAQRRLLRLLVSRDLSARYRSSMLGLGWTLVQPLLMLGAYLLVFGVVFAPRVAVDGAAARADLTGFGLALFAAILVHALLAETLVRAPGTVVGQPSYVTKVVFPLELLPLVPLGAALVTMAIGFAVLLAVMLVLGRVPGWQALWVPVALLPVVLLAAGVAWAFAALAVFFRDVAQLTGLLATLLLFLSPVFYSLDALPPALRGWMVLGPLAVPIEAVRGALFAGRAPDAGALALYTVAAAGIALAGGALFTRTRHGFADVL